MIFIYGSGARSKLVIKLIKELKIRKKIILIDKKPNNNKKIFSEDYLVKKFKYKKDELVLGFSNPKDKKETYERLITKGKFNLIKPLISKATTIKKKSNIGKGTIIMDGAYLSENVKIGENCFIGIDSLISHDAKFDDFVEISHKVKIAGNVKINKCSFVGMGAIITQNKKIKKNCFVGAGVLLKKNLVENTKITLKQNLKIK